MKLRFDIDEDRCNVKDIHSSGGCRSEGCEGLRTDQRWGAAEFSCTTFQAPVVVLFSTHDVGASPCKSRSEQQCVKMIALTETEAQQRATTHSNMALRCWCCCACQLIRPVAKCYISSVSKQLYAFSHLHIRNRRTSCAVLCSCG